VNDEAKVCPFTGRADSCQKCLLYLHPLDSCYQRDEWECALVRLATQADATPEVDSFAFWQLLKSVEGIERHLKALERNAKKAAKGARKA